VAPAKPRALLITPDFPPDAGGVQELLYNLVRHSDGFEWHTVTFQPRSRGRGVDADLSVQRVRRRQSGVGAVFALNGSAARAALAKRPSVVVSGHIVTAPAARAIRALSRTPIVQYVYAMELAHRPRFTRWVLRGADSVIAISRHSAALAESAGADIERIRVIPPGVNIPAEPSAEKRASVPTILSIARLEDVYKGFDVMMRALPLVRAQLPDVEWVVVGEGRLKAHLERLAKAYGVEPNVTFAGAVSNQERDRWLDRAHVLAMPARTSAAGQSGEGFGIVYLEAAARGLPVVAGAVGGALDAVIDGETGILVNPHDFLAVADALVELLASTNSGRDWGRATTAHARRFAWPDVVKRVEEVLIEQVGQGGTEGLREGTMRRTTSKGLVRDRRFPGQS